MGLTDHEYEQLRQSLEQTLRRELQEISRRHRFHLALSGCALLLFAIVLFLNAQRYHSPIIWVVGVCLMIFSLIDFLELEAENPEKSLFFLKRRIPSEESDHARKS
jgi:hypothetical protein